MRLETTASSLQRRPFKPNGALTLTNEKPFPLAIEAPDAKVIALTAEMLAKASTLARQSPRGRIIQRLHKRDDAPLHRMFNVMQPGSYARPHRLSEYYQDGHAGPSDGLMTHCALTGRIRRQGGQAHDQVAGHEHQTNLRGNNHRWPSSHAHGLSFAARWLCSALKRVSCFTHCWRGSAS